MQMNTCPECRGDAIEIEFERNELSFRMLSCSRCDTRSWDVDGAPSALPLVLRSMSDELIPANPTAI